MEIKKIDILSLAKIQGIIMFVIGFVLGIIGTIIGLFSNQVILNGQLLLSFLVVFPFELGIFGFISATIFAVLYNLISKYHGGLKIELKK